MNIYANINEVDNVSIRSTAKAIIIDNGKVLLNKCHDKMNGDYYSLPGGGQRQYETLHEALVRECLEETGYTVNPVRFAALYEEICLHEGFRRKYPDYAHKMYHIFVCELADAEIKTPSEKDDMQVGCVWADIGSLPDYRIVPAIVGKNLRGFVENAQPMYLGSDYVQFNHG